MKAAGSEFPIPTYPDGEVAALAARLAIVGGHFLQERKRGNVHMDVDLVMTSGERWPMFVDEEQQHVTIHAVGPLGSSRYDRYRFDYVKGHGGQYEYTHGEERPYRNPRAHINGGAERLMAVAAGALNPAFGKMNGTIMADKLLAIAQRIADGAESLPLEQPTHTSPIQHSSYTKVEFYPEQHLLIPVLGEAAAIASEAVLAPAACRTVAATVRLNVASSHLEQSRAHTSNDVLDNSVSVSSYDVTTREAVLFSLEAKPLHFHGLAVAAARLVFIRGEEGLAEQQSLNQQNGKLLLEQSYEIDGRRASLGVHTVNSLRTIITMIRKVV